MKETERKKGGGGVGKEEDATRRRKGHTERLAHSHVHSSYLMPYPKLGRAEKYVRQRTKAREREREREKCE